MINKIIHNTAAQFTLYNWTLNLGTIGFETDTKKFKFGDGVTAWTSLGYGDSGQAGPTLVTSPVGTAVVREYGNGKDVVATITLTNFIVGALAGAAASLGVGNIVATFPAGLHFEKFYGINALSLTCAGTAVATATGLGSVIASGAVSVLSGTATFQDRMTAQTLNTAAGGGAAVSAQTVATAGFITGIANNVTASVKNVFLNSAGAWNANNTGNLTASGLVVLNYSRSQ